MVKRKPVIIILLLLVMAMGVFLYIYQSEERQVRKRFKALAQTASRTAEDSQLIVAGKCRTISKFFADPCQVEAQEYNISKNYIPMHIRTISLRVLTRYEELKLRFVDLRIDIAEKGAADAVATARIIGKIRGDEEMLEENHEIQCRLKKIEDEWVFVKVHLVDVLQK